LIGGTVAELTTIDLPAGTDAIIATYSGDAYHNPSTAPVVSVSVQALAPTFALTATPQTLSLTSGQSGTVTLSFATNATFSGQITAACSGLPVGTTCSFSPSSLALTGGHSGTISAVISTAGPTQARLESQRPGRAPGQFPAWARTIGGLALAQCIVMIWPTRRHRRAVRAFAAWTVSLLCLAFFMALPGCGGGSKHGDGATPTGSSLVTVTATATSGSATVKQTAVVSITVKD